MGSTASDQKKTNNEAVFRERNERPQKEIEATNTLIREMNDGTATISDKIKLHFQCECSDENCTEPIPLQLQTYKQIHSDRDQFIVVPDHQVKRIEDVTEKHAHFYVVKKHLTPAEHPVGLAKTDIDNS